MTIEEILELLSWPTIWRNYRDFSKRHITEEDPIAELVAAIRVYSTMKLIFNYEYSQIKGRKTRSKISSAVKMSEEFILNYRTIDIDCNDLSDEISQFIENYSRENYFDPELLKLTVEPNYFRMVYKEYTHFDTHHLTEYGMKRLNKSIEFYLSILYIILRNLSKDEDAISRPE